RLQHRIRADPTERLMGQLELVPRKAGTDAPPYPAADVADRLEEMLGRYLGPVIVSAIGDPDVTEVHVNPQDCAVRFETRSRGKIDSGESLDAHRVEMFLNAVASRLGVTLTSATPR